MVTMDATRRVLGAGTGVACVDGHIAAVGPDDELRRRFADVDVLDARGGWLTPGLINAHQHLTGDRLARSTIPDDLAPGTAVFSWAVPLHAAHGPDDDEISALASSIESVRNGVTCVVEAGTVAHPERVATAMRAVGMRGTVGTWGWDIESGPFTGTTDEVIERQRAAVDAVGTDGLVRGCVTLVGHDLMSDELLVRASQLAREAQVMLTFHQSPTASDPQQWIARTGERPLVHFDRLGALGDHVLIAHAVHLDDREVEVILRTKTAVASCPWAYLRLGQGITQIGRHAELVERGGRVALGCDSENAGDQIDVLRAAALLAGLTKDMRLDPTRFGALEVFELATIRGAEAIGRGHDLGAIEVGRCADIVVHDIDAPSFVPAGGDPYLQLVWGTDGRSVIDVVIDGKVVVRNRVCVRVDERDVGDRARRAGQALLARTGLG
jgi:5-methylthioadenosine/S-adenosylhomocysteine deaminase